MGFRTTLSSSSSSSLSGRRKNLQVWSPSTNSTALTPTSLLRKYSLPIAAYLHTPETPPGLDPSRPILLYSNYTSKKIRAVSLRPSRNSPCGLYPVGRNLVIPDSYTGWFSVVTPEGRSAPYYSCIEEIARVQIPFFLTRFDIPAYIRVPDDNGGGRCTYRRTVIQSGHILKMLGIFEDLNSRRNLGGRSRGSEDSLGSCNKYIQSLNYCNEVIFVPFSVTGRFYPVAHKGKKTVNHVFLMSQLINTFKLPITVRLVCGYMPRVPQAFTGILRLEKIQKEVVILACTMTSEAQATLLEIDVSSNFMMSPITDPIFSKTPIFLKTSSYCSDEADSWRRQIKVTHHVTEHSSGSSLGNSSIEKSCMSSSSSGNRNFFRNFEKERFRIRDRSQTRDSLTRGRSEDIRLPERGKENRDRGREKSKESGLKERMMDKLQDLSRNSNRCVVSGEFISIRVDDKLTDSKAKGDNRKVSKQNTYIFNNERNAKYQETIKGSQTEENIPRSLENQDYSIVADDISKAEQHSGSPEYAEICEYGKIAIGVRQAIHRDSGARHWRSNVMDTKNLGSLSSTDEETNYSFTLLKKDMGKCYDKLPDLGVNDVYRNGRRMKASLC